MPLASASGTTTRPVMPKSAVARRLRWTNTWESMPDSLAGRIAQYLGALRRENASEHTIRNYKSDLDQFVAYFTPPEGEPAHLETIDTLALREWLGELHRQNL